MGGRGECLLKKFPLTEQNVNSPIPSGTNNTALVCSSNLQKNLSCVHIPALTDVLTLEEEKNSLGNKK